jgi:hypothetical protein
VRASKRPEFGTQFARLTYVGRASGMLGEFLCDCGTRKLIRFGNVQSGDIKSCGCLRKQETPVRRAAPKAVAGRACRRCGLKTYNYFHCSGCLSESKYTYAVELEMC